MKYIDALIEEYSKSYDIVRDYEIGGAKASAYGFFSKTSEKYVLSPKANLWTINGFEHILFFEIDKFGLGDIEESRRLMEEYMAPELVCKGRKYPDKDHMYSYLTTVYICDSPPDPEVIDMIRRFKYEKNYLLTIRGHVEGHMIVIDNSSGKVYTNKAAKYLIDFYEKVRDIK